MARLGVVKKPFPYARDGINPKFLVPGENPIEFHDAHFQGLVDAGFIEVAEEDDADEAHAQAANRLMQEHYDLMLARMSDQHLKDIIARSGKPYSGNLVHAKMVAAAKAQLVRELEGAKPVRNVDPNSGVTEQPLAKPGQATPPSAAAAVEKANEVKQDSQQGENKATNQFGEPLVTTKVTPDFDNMSKADLEQLAAEKGVDISQAKTKADIIEALNGVSKA